LFGQYQSARNQAEREERKLLVAAGADVTGRVFTPEEVRLVVMTLAHPTH